MERKTFLATAAGLGASIAAVTAAFGAPVPLATPSPAATMHARKLRNGAASNHNVHVIRKHLERVIDELQHDQHDYAGHRVKALDLLNQARQELLLAEQSDSGHQ